ncbi:Aldo/keto reductase [Clavulina sp. PMI_390]|nr:Aldo/keto reductase [Clavulina sp. PMI_390]
MLTISSKIKLLDGNEIPRLGLGVYKSSGASCEAACVSALEHGYIHIDSAMGYRNEVDVGRAVKKFKREDLWITSKIDSSKQGYESTLTVVDKSLSELGFEYIDLYLVHDPLGGKQKRLDTWRALVEAQKAGKVRSIGVSNFNVKHLEEIKEAGLPTPVVNQIELHPYCQQRPIAGYCTSHGIILEAYSPLIRGNIEDDVIKEIAAKKTGGDHFRVLVRWSLQKGYVPLPKSERAEKIKSNADVYGFELSAEEMAAIDALDKGKAGSVSWNPVDAE